MYKKRSKENYYLKVEKVYYTNLCLQLFVLNLNFS